MKHMVALLLAKKNGTKVYVPVEFQAVYEVYRREKIPGFCDGDCDYFTFDANEAKIHLAIGRYLIDREQ
jgi:hypothetical protein